MILIFRFIIRYLTIIVILFTSSCEWGFRFNLWGQLLVKPTVEELKGVYKLDDSLGVDGILWKLGYKNLNSTLILRPNLTYEIKNIPAYLINHQYNHNGNDKFFVEEYYSFKGNWEVIKIANNSYRIALSSNKINKYIETTLKSSDSQYEFIKKDIIEVVILKNLKNATLDNWLGFNLPDGSADSRYFIYEKS